MRNSHPKAVSSGLRRIVTLAVVAAGSLWLSGSAAAQQRGDVPVNQILRADGTYEQLKSSRPGFNLFAEEDLAGTSLRLTGNYRYPFINAGGLCPFANTSGDIFNTQCGQMTVAAATSTFFHNTVAWGIGPDDYRKIKDVHPGIANMRSPVGYSTPWRITSLAPITIRINAADGQFGQYYAGVTSLNGAGCRDFQGATGAGLPANFTLTAASDCPETWAGTGFAGMRELPDSVWLQRFNADKVNFRWDDFKIPASAYSDRPLGNNATYGAFSDYPREIVQLYGGVTPKGRAGDPPGERGFPIGIYVRADAWKFDRPSLRDGVFVRWLVINNSEKVWGQGIDYDKLYMGMDPGYVFGGQAPSAQNIPKNGAHLAMGGGWTTGRCTNTFPKRTLPGANEACGGTTTHINMVQFLKSPLGDLRNKVFTDPTSPYFFPNHPKADDTITFNHWVKGGFGAQDNFSWRRSDRALFGLMSGNETEWLDGRQFTDFTAAQIWNLFRYEGTDGTQALANLRYNKVAIGNVAGYGKWDYNDDGIQDTLFLPDCGQFGCAGLWGDSTANGYSNRTAGNIGNYLGVGPFKLKAGDTTEFLFYMGASRPDTISANRMIAASTGALFKNFAGASAYPTPVFTAADVQLNSAWFRDSVNSSQTTEIRMQVKMPPRTDDVFIKSVLARINQNEPVANNLRNLNPGLVAAVTGRMRQNLAQVLVFKTCDNGVSWTNTQANNGGCTNATGTFRTRNQDGVDIGTGWRPFATLNADSITGVLTNYVVSDVVQAGREYVYSYVTKTRGLFDISVVTAVTLNATGGVTTLVRDNLQNVLGIDIDTITSSLSPNGPFTVHAYAPISVPAGTLYARLDTTRTQGQTVTNRVANTARSAGVDGVFRMRFGNRFIITRTLDTVTSSRTTTLVRQSLYARAANSPAGTAVLNFVAAADTFVANHDFTYSAPAANALRTTPRFTTGTVQTFVDTVAAPGYVIAKGSGGSDAYYLSIGTSFIAFTQNTAEFEGSAWYPGFTATVNGETAPPATRNSFVLRGPIDTLNTGVVNANGVTYQSGSSGLRTSPGGFYNLTWAGNAFGPGENNSGFFTFGAPEVMQPIMNTSFNARETSQIADTTSTSRALILAGTNNIAGRPLLAAKLPFKVFGVNGQQAKAVFVQRHLPGAADSAFRNSRLLGTNGDTARVQIPPDMWFPGDTLYVVENIVTDSTATVGGTVTPITRDTTIGGRAQQLPIQVTREVYGASLMYGCTSNVNPTRLTCNPIRIGTKGATGYMPFESGWVSRIHLNRSFDQNSEVQLAAQPVKASVLPLQDADMDRIQVVPNPFVVQSEYDRLTSTRAIDANIVKFVNVPSEGLLRIYSVSGQLMQQITWGKSDLIANGNGSPHGDLPYNLRTREGLDLGSGLYVFVLTARGENANGKVARGKFVVIR